jgi:general secretion pathway protein D
MKTNRTLALFFLSMTLALAQQPEPKREPVAMPEPVVPVSPKPGLPPLQPAQPAAGEVAPPLPEKDAAPATSTSARPARGGIVLNFQGASLTDVLNYLSEAAGFVVVQEAQVSGTVNVVSRQPITPEEAVDLVNAVLIEKGFVAIRNGRILKIVSKSGAQKRDLPVQMGSDPEQIPRKDQMVTQILPLRYGEAAKLLENLRPLLSDTATISANEGSNSILLTDTQVNIRRIAEIIRAIDTSVASISTIRVYALQYADAKELATVVSQLFANNTTTSSRGRSRGGFGGGGGFPFPMPGGDRGGDSGGASEARQANARVVAVADEQSNSLIVSAPEELIPSITELVDKIDTSITDFSDTRIFRLQHADAQELATLITNLFPDPTAQGNQRRRDDRGGGGFGFPFGGGDRGGGSSSNGQQSQRALQQTKVVAVGDPRTNSLIVTASRETMTQIAEMVGRLDSTDAKKQRVFVHSLEHADAESVANVLRGMLGDQTAINNTMQSGASRLNQRSSTGATMDTSEFSNGGGGGGRSGGR